MMASFLVAFGTTVSAFWILALNSWMHTPQGFEVINGELHATDWWAIVFNPSMPYRLVHMLLASGLTVAFLIAGLSAYRRLRGSKEASVLSGLRFGIGLGALLIPLQILAGDFHGLNTLEHQPAKIAAMEGVWQTERGAPLLLFAWPDEKTRSNHFEIAIPRLASFILTHDANGEIKGLNEFAGAHPPVIGDGIHPSKRGGQQDHPGDEAQERHRKQDKQKPLDAGGGGDAAAQRMYLRVRTSRRILTVRDPWVNMLRTTVAAFGAGVGGADTVQILPFDDAIPGGLPTVSPDFARRIARNTQLLLLEESHIGRVMDPAGGSWYVEELTETLAAQAWSDFQDIESRGGFRAAIDHIAEQIDQVRGRRAADIAHRRAAITGINEFPNLAEAPLPQTGSTAVKRYAAEFEALRNRSDRYLERLGARPRVLLLPLGPLAENNIRASFATNLLASGGIEAVNPGTVAPDRIADAVRDAGTSIAVICGTDARYGAEVTAVVAAARAAGCEQIYLAGPEKAVADVAVNARPDGYLTAKVDAVEELSTLLTRLGA